MSEASPRDRAPGLRVGDRVAVVVGPVAHGGHCVARHEGQVIFVRHALPGERVVAAVTGLGPGGRFVRADAVEIERPSPDRVQPPCPFSGPGRCGGCDWQHASLEAQRRLKAEVVAEQLVRLGGFGPAQVEALDLVCEPVPGDLDGLRWRTRVEVAVAGRAGGDGQGRGDGKDGVGGRTTTVTGLRSHRSHEVIDVDDCRIAHPGVLATGVFDPAAEVPPRVVALDAVAPSVGAAVVVPLAPPEDDGRGRSRGRGQGRARGRRGARQTPRPVGDVPKVTERVGGHEFTLSARGFWQAHPGTATVLTEQVMAWLDPQPGESALDLYSGVGLFAVPLAKAVGEKGSVLAVETDSEATRSARRHLAAYPWAEAVAESVEKELERLSTTAERADVVVLDPPRTGAGRGVVESLAALGPRAVVYVACDPAALARDLRTARDVGLELAAIRVVDAFPMTHHIETLALLRPAGEPVSPTSRPV